MLAKSRAVVWGRPLQPTPAAVPGVQLPLEIDSGRLWRALKEVPQLMKQIGQNVRVGEFGPLMQHDLLPVPRDLADPRWPVRHFISESMGPRQLHPALRQRLIRQAAKSLHLGLDQPVFSLPVPHNGLNEEEQVFARSQARPAVKEFQNEG